MHELTVIAVDWSGAKIRPAGIWMAVVRAGEVVESCALATREEAVGRVTAVDGRMFAGFDFSFGLPAWFARELGCARIEQVWDTAAAQGERWLGPPPRPPFWRERCDLPPARRFRRCEARLRPAKSVFQLVGPGQVGPGTVRGVPLLRDLRRAGVAVWPFDAARGRTAFEIYPSALRALVPGAGPFANEHERDAVCSALVMWRHRDQLGALAAASDPVTRLEGDIWTPAATPSP